MFKKFLADESAFEMYITGGAGVGKTTSLQQIVLYLQEQDISYIVLAYTHKAINVLKSKIGEAHYATLHSFLKRRPSINDSATKLQHLEHSSKAKEVSMPKVILIDEFSMIGEEDYMSLGSMQDPDCTGLPSSKIVYIGDECQLPPVGDLPAIWPSGDYVQNLTKVYRQNNYDFKILLSEMRVAILNSRFGKLKQFLSSANISSIEIVDDLVEANLERILAFTNRAVQEYNFRKYGEQPRTDIECYSPTLKRVLTWEGEELVPQSLYNGREHLVSDKYNTLSYINERYQSVYVKDEDDNQFVIPIIFGHYNWLIKRKELALAATQANQAIVLKYKIKPKEVKAWCIKNRASVLARARAKAWRAFLVFDQWVQCLDHNLATTIHKSQGSTFETVGLDLADLDLKDKELEAKLIYVGASRASKKLYLKI